MNRMINGCIATLTIPLAIAASAWFYVQAKSERDVNPYDYEDPFSAVIHGNLDAVKRHVDKDPKTLKKVSPGGNTLLNEAALWNHPEIVRYLLKKGAKVDAMGPAEYTPLLCAASSPKAFPANSGQLLIEYGANVNYRMGEATGSDRVAAVGLLSGIGWRWGGGIDTGPSVLDTASRMGHADLVKLLLKKGATPFTRQYSRLSGKRYLIRTSLHRACEGAIAPGYLDSKDPRIVNEFEDNHRVIEALLPVVKDINIKDVEGRTPLHIAALHGRDKVAAYLLKTYPKVELNARDKAKNTPLHLAVKGVADYLRRYPDSTFSQIRERLTVISVLLKHKPDLMITNIDGQTPHELAGATGNKELTALLPTPPAAVAFELAQKGKLDALKKIVEKNAAIVKKFDVHGWTLLHRAAEGNHTEVIRYLVKKGAGLESHDDPARKGKSGFRPLHAAATNASFEAAKLLIELGADPKARLTTGEKNPAEQAPSALDIAASTGDARFVKLLLDKGVPPFTKPQLPDFGPWGWTSLHSACAPNLAPKFQGKPEYAGNRQVIRLLVPVVKDVNVKVEFTGTPLHVAAASGNAEVVEFLLKTYPKVDVNAKDAFGNTPLHLAIESFNLRRLLPKRRVATIKALLKHKPDLTIKNNAGQTPRELARASGNKAITALFP